ncbi:hypothetical protein IU433_26930 [Nocardia puris]|uniref:hypothetical protein n=1 Tax=Nocardia puris TaxID=208602 RepID=UPI0018958D54|nr:hypothetical protein [Nocardia puris]MBF6213027.1 hypothetical protein [Nocardia puris]MBF6368018.1 hypothetical protein [Nocardia puris]MBF6462651.1 hypothetical protein [Nocardia puris]
MRLRRVLVTTLAALVVSACWAAPAPAAPPAGDLSALWTTPAKPSSEFDFLLAFSFGNRIPEGVDPQRTVGAPGPVNEALAAAVVATRNGRDIPVYAQTEIAEVLRGEYALPDVVSIDPDRADDGTLVYLSTDGVAARAAELRGDTDGIAGVIAFHDHLWRAVHTTRTRGLTAFAPEDVPMPTEYDPLSGQPWTTSRERYLPTDYAGRIPLLPGLLGR